MNSPDQQPVATPIAKNVQGKKGQYNSWERTLYDSAVLLTDGLHVYGMGEDAVAFPTSQTLCITADELNNVFRRIFEEYEFTPIQRTELREGINAITLRQDNGNPYLDVGIVRSEICKFLVSQPQFSSSNAV